MANNEDKLSRLYREGLGDFVKDPPHEAWPGIKRGLLIRNLLTFKFMTSLNIYSVAVFIAIAAISGFFIGKQLQTQNENVTAVKNIPSMINKTPYEPEKTQNIKQEQNNLNQVQNIDKGKVTDQPKINSVKPDQFQNQEPVTANLITGSEKPVESPTPVYDITNDKSLQKDNVIKPPEILIEKPVLIDSSKIFDKGINPIEPEKQPTENNLNKEERNLPPEQPEKQPEANIENIKPGKPKTTQGFYAEIFAAPSFLTYKFEQSTINPSVTFVNTSKKDEKPALSYTAGLELGYGLKHLFAQTGFNYSDYRSTTLIDLLNSYTILTTNLKKDSVLVKDTMGNHYYTYFNDTIRVLTSKDTQISHRATNSLRYIEIPILIGYRFYGKRMSYAVSGGISIGYLSSSGGETLNPDLKSVSANTTEAIPFKPWTFYLLLRAEAAYLVKKDLSIFIRPGFKYNMNSVFEDYYPVKKTFYTLDLHLGLRYIF